MATNATSKENPQKQDDIDPQIISLKTPLVASGMTRDLLAQGDHSTLRIHCYASGMGEDHGLHAHIEEEHVFIILMGTAQFNTNKGKLPPVGKNQGIWLPKGCFYEFVNVGDEPLVILRFGASEGKMLRASRLTPDGKPIPGRSKKHPHLSKPTFLKDAFFE